MIGALLSALLLAQPQIPAADRLFTVQLGGAADHLIVGAERDELFLLDPAEAQPRWRVKGPGVAHKVIAADLGEGERLYVAWGVGRGFLDAPLMLTALDPATGTGALLWTYRGPRSEVTHLSASDVDGDGRLDLAVAYYATKYQVRTHHITAAGRIIEGPPVRMANAWAFGDLNGDGKPEAAVGRVYGDRKGEAGDLRVEMQGRRLPVETDNGVRAVVIDRLSARGEAALFFSDGWVANYGKEARANLKRATWRGDRFVTETLGRAPQDFTFFEIYPVDTDGDGFKEIVARGNRAIYVFKRTATGWHSQTAAQLRPVLNMALGQLGGRWWAYIPSKGESLARHL